MGDVSRVAILGAGAMGTALAVHAARNGARTVLLATDHDEAVVDRWRRGLPHPSLDLPFHHHVRCVPDGEWADVLPRARVVIVAVSSAGLPRVLAQAARIGAPDAIWVLATKGWSPDTLQTPSQVAGTVLGDAPVVSLAGPALAAEILAGSPTGLLCASRDQRARRCAADVLASPTTAVFTTSDIAGAETAAAFKNVVAVAVGLAEGLSDRLGESGVVATFANARAAVFARGMMDMLALVEAQGGRAATVLGLAGAGDLYVTCQHGRNGRFGRLLGSGATVEGAVRSIGSTVEGVASTAPALLLAEHAGLDLPSARVVELALKEELTGERVSDRLRDLFLTVVSGSRPARSTLAGQG
ncbi:MAG TPA: NAD(P)H-dependent glycerol-3-phosphate dehydrogenase [Streptosporangiaceae bacterium]|nr:NAD(P)H-dependent glycerol-3-phosphate dehydrogenase [Streptosporangiaceae bacterium]